MLHEVHDLYKYIMEKQVPIYIYENLPYRII